MFKLRDVLRDLNCRYGAPMGRHSTLHPDQDGARLRVAEVRLDGGGYDRGGAYWGSRGGYDRLFVVWCVDTGDARFFACRSRLRALVEVLRDYPGASVGRAGRGFVRTPVNAMSLGLVM